MMKKVLYISFWSGIILGTFFLLGFSKSKQSVLVCNTVEIDIDYSNKMFFLRDEDITEQLKMSGYNPVGRMMKEIRLKEIEKLIHEIPEVKAAEVHKTIDGKIGMKIRQRTPVARVLNLNGRSFFIDDEGKQMQVTGRYYPRILVVNGFISEPELSLSADEIERDSSLMQKLKTDDIYRMAVFIRNDPFWSAQIQQLYFNEEGEMELIPMVGQHRIIFGTAEHMNEKFNKLFLFYKKGLKKAGWNKYKTVNLKFKNQVVCTKL